MPEWLPEMFCVSPWWGGAYEALYKIFCHDIRDANLYYKGNRVWMFTDKEDGKEDLFWHLTSREVKKKSVPRRKQKFQIKGILRENQEEERLPDLRRCERLSWVNPLISHSDNDVVTAWDYEEGDGAIKSYVWFKEGDFVVIMKCYPDMSRRLITSFYVDEEYTRKGFERKYANRVG